MLFPQGPDPERAVPSSGGRHDGPANHRGVVYAETSRNWSGQIAAGTTFTGAAGEWTVPSVVPSVATKDDANWIGIGGAGISQLIQTGTTSATTGGKTSYWAWYELLPAGPVTLREPVSPGDHMEAVVKQSSAVQWYIGIEDLTKGWTVTGTVSYYAGLADSAEWITERSYDSATNSLTSLADFGSVRFHNLKVSGTDLAAVAVTGMEMTDTTGRVIAYPSTLATTTTGSFTDYYGAPGTGLTGSPAPHPTPPVVFSLTPSKGYVGTTVTIIGSHLTGATSVDFGQTPSAIFRVIAPDEMTAVAPRTSGTFVTVTVTTPAGRSVADAADIFTYVPPVSSSRIFGVTADTTAAAELEHQFTVAAGDCPGSPGTRPVILATDQNYPDALSSAYLAQYLGTGTLLTPTASLSAPTVNALHDEGITKVYVVGGKYALSTTVVSELSSMVADECGGVSAAPGTPRIAVQRISGTTEYTTAAKIAETVPASSVGSFAFPGAYSGTTAAGGPGRYNESTGGASRAPSSSTSLPTAIVATGAGFQDAESASTMAYAEHFPILLTTPAELSPQVTGAIKSLGITQVIVVGGQYAVSDNVVASLQSLGISVLRIAGTTASGTSVELAEFETTGDRNGLGWVGDGSITVARGDGYTDGLAGAVVGADGPTVNTPEPLVLTVGPATVGAPLIGFLQSAGTTGLGGEQVTHLTVLGGPDAVTATAVDTMESALSGN